LGLPRHETIDSSVIGNSETQSVKGRVTSRGSCPTCSKCTCRLAVETSLRQSWRHRWHHELRHRGSSAMVSWYLRREIASIHNIEYHEECHWPNLRLQNFKKGKKCLHYLEIFQIATPRDNFRWHKIFSCPNSMTNSRHRCTPRYLIHPWTTFNIRPQTN